MFHRVDDISISFAVAIGAYLAAVGLGILFAPQRWSAIIDEFDRSPALTYVAGALAFWVGARILMSGYSLIDWVATVVTLFAFATAAKGLLILIFPRQMLDIYRPLLKYPPVIGAASVALGLVLLIPGLIGLYYRFEARQFYVLPQF